LSVLRTYGVRWIVIYTGPEKPKTIPGVDENLWRRSPAYDPLVAAIAASCPILINSPDIKVYELGNAAPLAFVAGDPRYSLPMRSDGSGIDIDTRSLHSEANVVVNVLAARSLNAYADGRYLAGTTDGWGRMVFQLPNNIKRLQILYRPPWLAGVACGITLAACAVMLMRCRNRFASVSLALGFKLPMPGETTLRPAA
jgi:hypothetical protein